MFTNYIKPIINYNVDLIIKQKTLYIGLQLARYFIPERVIAVVVNIDNKRSSSLGFIF